MEINKWYILAAGGNEQQRWGFVNSKCKQDVTTVLGEGEQGRVGRGMGDSQR